MYCPNCGEEVGKSRYCSSCGTPVNRSPQSKEAEAVSPARPVQPSGQAQPVAPIQQDKPVEPPAPKQFSKPVQPPVGQLSVSAPQPQPFDPVDAAEMSNMDSVQPPVSEQPLRNKTKVIKIVLLVISCLLALCLIVIVIKGIQNGMKSVQEKLESSGLPSLSTVISKVFNSEEPERIEHELEPLSVELGSGHYTAGIDIPTGTYNLKALKGKGNVLSSNMYRGGLNTVMGVGDSDLYTDEFKNLKLPEGETLTISGVVLQLDSEEVDPDSLKPRKNTATEEMTLTGGNYTAGTDFAVGTYNIALVKGKGNVMSNNMFDGGLNVIMGEDRDVYRDMCIQSFQNATFDKGDNLTISGCTVLLTPSK